MTKCTVIFEQPKQGKQIEFVKCLQSSGTTKAEVKPAQYQNIELIAFNYEGGLDLMFCYDSSRNLGALYLGHWNDGYAE
jgi:hypothetical protein